MGGTGYACFLASAAVAFLPTLALAEAIGPSIRFVDVSPVKAVNYIYYAPSGEIHPSSPLDVPALEIPADSTLREHVQHNSVANDFELSGVGCSQSNCGHHACCEAACNNTCPSHTKVACCKGRCHAECRSINRLLSALFAPNDVSLRANRYAKRDQACFKCVPRCVVSAHCRTCCVPTNDLTPCAPTSTFEKPSHNESVENLVDPALDFDFPEVSVADEDMYLNPPAPPTR
jgi:hypothetical protein